MSCLKPNVAFMYSEEYKKYSGYNLCLFKCCYHVKYDETGSDIKMCSVGGNMAVSHSIICLRLSQTLTYTKNPLCWQLEQAPEC